MSKVLNNLLGSVYTVNNVPTAGAKALKYTTIGRFLYWLNDSFMLRDENGYKLHEFYVGKHDYECKPEDDKRKYENRTPFITFEHHFCTAIERFILPKLGQDRYKPFHIKYASDETLEQIIIGDGTDILDILISLEYIQGKFEGIVTGVDETSINIYDFVKEIFIYPSQRNGAKKSDVDLMCKSFLTKDQIKSFDYSDTMCRMKISNLLKRKGFKGRKTATHKGREYTREISLEIDNRVVVEESELTLAKQTGNITIHNEKFETLAKDIIKAKRHCNLEFN